MKMDKGYFFYVVLIILVLESCTKSIVPAHINGMQGEDYDEAQFNFLYVEGIKQKLMGNAGDALKYFEQCIKVKPESDPSYYQMAQILLAGGDIKNGKKFAQRAVSIDDRNIWYLMMMAGIYYQERNLDSAIIYYERAVEYYPEKVEIQLNLGNLYSEKGIYQKANNIYYGLDEKYGINKSYTIALIKNLMEEEKFDEALKKTEMLLEEDPEEILFNGILAEIYRAKGETEKAISIYNKLIERNPDNPQTQLSLCNFLLEQKSYDQLFLLLNTVIINEKINIQDKISLMGQLLEETDLINTRGRDFEITLMVFEASNGENDIVRLLRPELLIKQRKLIEASELFEEVIKIMPENYYAWEKLLLVILELKDYEKLFIKGKESATIFNRSFLIKILYANGALETGNYEIALDEIRKAEILAGDNKELKNQIYAMKADAYYRMKDYDKAFEIFKEAIAYDNEDLVIINNYSYYLAEQNINLKEAEALIEKVIEKEPNNNTFLDTYAWVLYKRGRLREAAKLMERIINSGEEENATWYEHYGYILKDQRKCEEATENWNMALKLDSTLANLITEIENCKK